MEIKKNQQDRRIGRTRKLLQDALVSLIQEKDYDAITVQDLLDRANVGRSTFYSHFLDKDMLLFSGLEELRNDFEERHRQLVLTGELQDQRLTVSLAFFQHAATHHRLYKAVVGKRSGSMVTKKLFTYLTELFREHLTNSGKSELVEDVPLELAVQFLASSLMGVLTWWFDNDLPYSAEQMNRWFHQLAVYPLVSVH